MNIPLILKLTEDALVSAVAHDATVNVWASPEHPDHLEVTFHTMDGSLSRLDTIRHNCIETARCFTGVELERLHGPHRPKTVGLLTITYHLAGKDDPCPSDALSVKPSTPESATSTQSATDADA